MKKITFLAVLLITAFAYAQPVSGYSFSESTETYAAVAGVNATATGDDGTDNDNDIGFAFPFGDDTYTTFSISTNGFIRLGQNIGGQNWINVIANDAAQRPLIAPFWDDHNRNAGAIRYQLLGTAPNRTLEVGWNNINISNGGNTSATTFASFKLRLHETSGQIDFVYGPSMVSAGGITASVGINDDESFLSILPGNPASFSSANASNAISATDDLIGRKYTFMPLQCSGQPDPGVTLTVLEICAGFPFTLSVENETVGAGVSYQWESSADGTTWQDIADANSQTLELTQLTDTYYRLRVSCGAQTSYSDEAFVMMAPPAGCYCFPTYETGKTDGDLIANVVIPGTSLANNSGTEPVNPSYTYFTGANQTAELQAGVGYDLEVSVGSYAQQNIAAWIDFNGDNVFDESEKIGVSSDAVDSFGTTIIPFQLGCNIMAGTFRLRVRDVWNMESNAIQPCATYNYGETEDYDVTILTADACSPAYGITVSDVNPSSAIVNWNSGCGQNMWDLVIAGASGQSVLENVTAPVVLSGLDPFTEYELIVVGHCEGGLQSSSGSFYFVTEPMAVPNDECDTSVPLIPGGSFDENAVIGTNVGATKSIGPPNPTCATFGFGGDVWYSITVPANGNVTIETKADPGSSLIDTGLTVFTGDCSALTALGCSDDEGDDAFSVLNLSGLNPGETIYARVWEYANDTFGTFRVSAWNASLSQSSFDRNGFTFYPNPTQDVLNFRHNKAITSVRLINSLGQTMVAKPIGSMSGTMETGGLPTGAYFLEVESEGNRETFKVLKR